MDTTELMQQIRMLEKELEFYKDYDTKTGVQNKDAFYKKVLELHSLYPEEKFQIIFIDIERFKLVNDFYGTEQGDRLLRYMADEIKTYFAGEKICYTRFGADTFTVFRPSCSHEESMKTAEDIRKMLRKYPLDMEIRVAIGFYEIIDWNIPVSLMCDRAGIAAASIKGSYETDAIWYERWMRNFLVEEHELLNGLDSSLKNGEFKIYIQPKCNMRTEKITGGEVLVRWQHPQKGMIPPKDFIPIFEKNGFIKNLDKYVWEETAKWMHKRNSAGKPVFPVSVNISRIDIFGIDVCQFFETLIHKYKLHRDWIELEITESACINQTEEVISVINKLMDNGFTVSMDDFGSGYSSLNMLKDINIDVLKLDMRFLDNDKEKSRSILESVVRMARWMDLKIIAEGVEHKKQVDFLKNIGCTYAQGFYYYKPMPLQEFEELLENPEKVDFNDSYMKEDNPSTLIHMREFLAEDVLSEVILNNLMGMVVIYSFDGKQVEVVQGNLRYYQTLHPKRPHGRDVSRAASEQIVEADRKLFLQGFRDAKPAGDAGASVTLRRYLDDGSRVWLRLQIFFLSEKNGKGIYYASISDVTGYMEALEKARVSEALFKTAVESCEIIIFELDIASRKIYYSRRTQEILGVEENFCDAPDGLFKQGCISPEDEKEIRKMYDAIYRGEASASCQVKIMLQDGTVVESQTTLIAIPDEEGKVVKALGVVQKI